MNILIVEDNPIIRADFAQQFRKHGNAVTEAKDGDEAMHLLEAGRKFDLILLDMQMPVMSGDCFIKKAKAADLLHCPAIIVTAYVEQVDRDEALQRIPEYKGTLRKLMDTNDLPLAVSTKLADGRGTREPLLTNGKGVED